MDEFVIVNDQARAVDILLEAKLVTSNAQSSSAQLRTSAVTKSYRVNSSGTPISERIRLRPGQNILSLTSDAPRVVAPGDPRTMVLQVRNVRIRTAK